LFGWEFWKLTNDGLAEIFVGDDPETGGRRHGSEARYSLLDHGVLTVQCQQLLRSALAA
jgi:hypothetical protein